MYEGGYWNGEQWDKGKSHDLNGKIDFKQCNSNQFSLIT